MTQTRKTKTAGPKRDIAQEVTDLIIEQLEKGVIPWHKPWASTGGLLPRSMATGKLYTGSNSFLLGMYTAAKGYSSHWWGTYGQIQEQGGQVRKGEKGQFIIFYKMIPTKEVDNNGKPKMFPLLKSWNVFNASQCDGLPAKYTDTPEVTTTEHERHEAAEAIRTGYLAAGGPNLQHGGDQAYYSPRDDMVNVPELAQFESAESYYSVLFHELTHSTGAEKRLNREGIVEGHRFGDALYAAEELIAEMGAAMLCATAGIDQAATVPQSAAYINGWLSKLRGDKKLVMDAASKAQRATNLIAPAADSEESEKELAAA